MRDITVEDDWYSPSYEDLVASFEVEVLIEESDSDYQGDTYYLLRDGTHYGILVFGWGSCSGCDALQACSSMEEYTSLRDHLWSSVHWKSSARELLHYATAEKDWELDWVGHREAGRTFLAEVKEMLDTLARAEEASDQRKAAMESLSRVTRKDS